MKKKRASELFHQVDPHLRVIDGGTHRKRRLTKVDWNKAGGVVCPNCGQETLRIVDGVCLQCYRDGVAEREGVREDEAERHYYKEQLKKGTISLAQMKEGRL